MSATAFLDACGFNPASGGTGDFVVSAAITGYQTPASAGAVNGTIYSYRAQSTDLSQWEVGFGAYTSGTTTLARTTVVASSTGSKVNFTAPPSVYVTALSADLLNASLFTSGTMPTARLPLGTGANQVPQLDGNGKLLNAVMGASSIGSAGYYTLPGGLIIQWGTVSGSDPTVTFPTAFPTACYGVVSTGAAPTLAATVIVSSSASSASTTSFIHRGRYNTGGSGNIEPTTFFWFAWGK